MTATGAWAQTETLLTTINSTSPNDSFTSGSMTFDNIATVSFSGEVINDDDFWGWYSYDGAKLTVTPAEGYTITRVKFYAANESAFDESAPFEAILVNENSTIVKVNDSSIGNFGVTKIEVYGYETPSAAPTDPDYYLVGTMNDWGASKQFLLTPNPDNAAEYMITLNLKAGTQLKVIGVDAQNNATWYPSGNNYYVNDAGKYTVYFRPDGSGDQGEGWHYGYIYLDAAPAPAIPLTDLGSGQWQFQMPDYAVVAKIEYDTELELQEENVNTAVLEDWDGYEADITLQRKLIAGSWNTLAVPFNVSSTMLGYLTSTYGMQVKQLSTTSLEGETITLTFADATQMEAGKPYLVKVTTDFDFSAQALPNVEVSKELNPVTTTYADFIPTLGKTTIENVSADDVLFIAAGNLLKNPSAIPAYMKGFRAYFQLKNVPAETRTFALNLGDKETGITTTDFTDSTDKAGAVYDLQGRRMESLIFNSQSSIQKKGVYIVNGKKVIK